jgi:hypothetical protein
MRSHILFLAGLVFIAGLSGCSDSGGGPIDAEDQMSFVSDKLTPEESALVASGEAEAGSNPQPVSLEAE